MKNGVNVWLIMSIDKPYANNVVDDECEDDHRGDALKHIGPVAAVRQPLRIRLAAKNDPHTVKHVKQKWREEQGPFNSQQIEYAAQQRNSPIKSLVPTLGKTGGKQVVEDKK